MTEEDYIRSASDPRVPELSLADAVALVEDGVTLGLGGFSLARNAVSFAMELIRQGRRNLTVSHTIAGMETDLLVGAGCVDRLLYSGGSLDRFGQLQQIGRAVENGGIQAESYSGLSLVLRYLAGSLGIPFIPAQSLLQSHILDRLVHTAPDDVKQATSPFAGEQVVLLRSLQPEIAVVVVHAADRNGNFIIDGPTWDNEQLIAAADSVILIADRLVDTAEFRRTPNRARFAANAVAVVHQGWAAYPTAFYGVHDYDAAHLQHYVAAGRSAEGFSEYLREYVLDCHTHEDFVNRGLAGTPEEVLHRYGNP